MTITDLDQVIEIDHASFTLPWPQSSFKFEIEKNEASRCWVAVSGSKIVGMIVTWLIVDEVHIATFAVSPTLRRHKIAKHLLAHTLMDAYKQGARKAFLEVRERTCLRASCIKNSVSKKRVYGKNITRITRKTP
jgi:ribosomal-protein-alanine N-acetyltransferase